MVMKITVKKTACCKEREKERVSEGAVDCTESVNLVIYDMTVVNFYSKKLHCIHGHEFAKQLPK